MSGGVHCPQRGPLHLEDLAILDVLLPFVRLVLIHLGLGADFEKIGDALDMVVMPVRDQGLFDRSLLLRQYGLEECRPAGAALACVYEETPGTPSDEVCVGPCKGSAFSSQDNRVLQW